MNFRQAATSRRSPPVINMTPLIDVVFILLIFFLLTTTFRNAAGLNVNLPTATTSESQSTKTQMMLTINREGDLFLQDQKLSQQQAITHLKKLSETQRDTLVILQADEEVPHGKVVEVLDELRAAGLQKIAIGAHPQPQQ